VAPQLWGRVQGTTRDYYIAVGLGASMTETRKLFYSTDGVAWAQLPVPHAVIAASCLRLRTRFTGDAASECVITEPAPPASAAPVSLPADMARLRTVENGIVTTRVAEDMRLAAAVAAVTRECALVPRGALRKTPAGALEPVRSFAGLDAAAAAVLPNYLRLFVPAPRPTGPLRSGYEPAIDCLAAASLDAPAGVWALAIQHTAAPVAVLKNLHWPGFVFTHTIGTAQYGVHFLSGRGAGAGPAPAR
jgi:radial spoke head protein 9